MKTVLMLLADSRFPSGGHAHSAGLEAAVAAGRVRCPSTLESFLAGRLHTTGLVNAAFAAAAHSGLSRALDEEFDARTPSPAQRTASRRQGKALMRAAQAIWPDAVYLAESCLPSGSGGAAGEAGLPRAGGVAAACLPSGSGGAAGKAGLPRAGGVAAACLPSGSGGVAGEAGLPRAGGVAAGMHFPLALGVTAAAAGLSEVEAASLAVYHQVTGQASAALRLLGLSPYDIQALLVRLAPQCDAVAAQGAAFAGKDPAELPMLSSPMADISAEHHVTWEVRLFAS